MSARVNPQFKDSRLETNWTRKKDALERKHVYGSFLEILLSCLPGSLGRKYSALRTRRWAKIRSVEKKRFFGVWQVAGAINAAQHQVLRSKEDLKNAKALLKQIKNNPATDELYKMKVHDQMQSRMYQGICLGISIDVAKQLLVDKKTPETIIKSLERGGTADAAANQAVYMAIDAVKKDSIGHLFHLLKQLGKKPGIPSSYRADFDKVQTLLDAMNDPKHLFEGAFHGIKTNLKNPLNPSQLPKFLQEVVKQRPDLELEYRWAFTLYQVQRAYKNLAPPPKSSQNAFKQILNRAFQVLKRILANDHIEYDDKAATLNGKPICDPGIGNFLLSLIPKAILHDAKVELLAAARGLKLTPCLETMGMHRFYRSDHDYLLGIQSLSSGAYLLTTETGTSRHAITYIKNQDGSGYIIDPNGVQIAFDSPQVSVGLMLDVLSFYGRKEGCITHGLELFRYSAA